MRNVRIVLFILSAFVLIGSLPNPVICENGYYVSEWLSPNEYYEIHEFVQDKGVIYYSLEVIYSSEFLCNVFICDESNFNTFVSDQQMTYYNLLKIRTSGSKTISFEVPYNGTWYVVMQNTGEIGNFQIRGDVIFDYEGSTPLVDPILYFNQTLVPNGYFQIHQEQLAGVNLYYYTHLTDAFGAVSTFICNRQNFRSFRDGENYTSHMVKEVSTSPTETYFEVPTTGTWYVVFENSDPLNTATIYGSIVFDYAGAMPGATTESTSETTTSGGVLTPFPPFLGSLVQILLPVGISLVAISILIYAYKRRESTDRVTTEKKLPSVKVPINFITRAESRTSSILIIFGFAVLLFSFMLLYRAGDFVALILTLFGIVIMWESSSSPKLYSIGQIMTIISTCFIFTMIPTAVNIFEILFTNILFVIGLIASFVSTLRHWIIPLLPDETRKELEEQIRLQKGQSKGVTRKDETEYIQIRNIREFERALEQHPEDITKIYGTDTLGFSFEALGRGQIRLKNHRKAIEYFNKSLKYKPELIGPWFGLLTSYVAIKAYDDACRIFPTVWSKIGFIDLGVIDYDKISPIGKELYFGAFQILPWIKDYCEHPDDREMMEVMVDTIESGLLFRDPEAAKQKVESTSGQKLDEGEVGMIDSIQEIKELSEDPIGKSKFLSPSFRFRTQNDSVAKEHYNAGIAFTSKSDYQKAVESFRLCVESNPDKILLPSALHAYALLSAATNDYDTARATLERLLSIKSESHSTWKAAGEIYEMMGDTSKAKACFKTAENYDKDSEWL